MLGRDFQLAADVVRDELTEEVVVFVAHHVVKSDSRADEDLLHARYRRRTAKKLGILALVRLKIRARARDEATSVGTYAVFELFFAGGCAEIRRRSADVVDISLKSVKVGYELNLIKDGFNASRAHGASLMERKRTEIASAEAAPVVRHGELHLGDGGHAAVLFVHGVIVAHIRELVDVIELVTLQKL